MIILALKYILKYMNFLKAPPNERSKNDKYFTSSEYDKARKTLSTF